MNENTSALIKAIVTIEWTQFSQVNNTGGPAQCQNNLAVFCAMRTIQAAIWQDKTLACYLNDLQQAQTAGLNLMTEKYAHMMATTHPAEYQRIKDQLPPVSMEKYRLVDAIMTFFSQWETEAMPIIASNNTISFQPAAALIYLRGELLTYSLPTLECCLADVHEANIQGRNLTKEILIATLRYYGTHTSEPSPGKQQGTSSSCRCGIETVIGDSEELTNFNQMMMQELLNYELLFADSGPIPRKNS